MYNFSMTVKQFAAVASLGVLALAGADLARAQAPATKNYKDQGEYDIYNEVTKDVVGNNFTKAITDLDTWKNKYPESDYRNDRSVLYVQAYAGAKQFNKAVDAAGELINKGLDQTLNDPKTGARDQITVLFTTCQAIGAVQNPTP